MTGRPRRELHNSFRLIVDAERWFLRDVILGAVGLAIWITGTWILIPKIVHAAGISLGVGSTTSPSITAVAIFCVIWVVIPAIAIAVEIRRRTVNIRGNIEKHYRVDLPGSLLAPPALFLAVAGAILLVLGTVPWYVTIVLVPFCLFGLVRTLAYSYRVYSFSYPLIVQLGVFVSAMATIAGALLSIATATGRQSDAVQALSTLGIPARFASQTTIAGVTGHGLWIAILPPIGIALAYLLVQSTVAQINRTVEPAVDRDQMRSGQRYPPYFERSTQVVTPPRANGGTRPSTKRGGHADASEAMDGTGSSADTRSTADSDMSSETDVDSAIHGGGAGTAQNEADLDDVSHTRVFTPPASERGPATGGNDTDAGESGDRDPVSNDLCPSCGATLDGGSSIQFCPHCGTQLDG